MEVAFCIPLLLWNLAFLACLWFRCGEYNIQMCASIPNVGFPSLSRVEQNGEESFGSGRMSGFLFVWSFSKVHSQAVVFIVSLLAR